MLVAEKVKGITWLENEVAVGDVVWVEFAVALTLAAFKLCLVWVKGVRRDEGGLNLAKRLDGVAMSSVRELSENPTGVAFDGSTIGLKLGTEVAMSRTNLLVDTEERFGLRKRRIGRRYLPV